MEEVEQKIILAEVEMEAEHHLAGSKLGLRYTSAVSMVAYVSLPPVYVLPIYGEHSTGGGFWVVESDTIK